MIPKFLLPLKNPNGKYARSQGYDKGIYFIVLNTGHITSLKVPVNLNIYIPKTCGRVLEKQDSLIFYVLWLVSVKYDRETIYNGMKGNVEAYGLNRSIQNTRI